MTNGVLCFANNNDKINYILQAQELAIRVRKYLDLPTTIVHSIPEQVDTYSYKVITVEHPMEITKDTMTVQAHIQIFPTNAGRINSFDPSYDPNISFRYRCYFM